MKQPILTENFLALTQENGSGDGGQDPMEEQGLIQRYDSEPLFGDDVYRVLVREDSLLHRTPSSAFVNLIGRSLAKPAVPVLLMQLQ